MTVYVDDFRAPATVGRLRSRWSHLSADTREELHAFAASIGLRRDWFQANCKLETAEKCPHWHYDVTDGKRTEAIKAGAKPIDIREMGAIISARRAETRAARGDAL